MNGWASGGIAVSGFDVVTSDSCSRRPLAMSNVKVR